MLTAIHERHFSETGFQFYEAARLAPQWNPRTDIPWESRSPLSKELVEVAWRLASQGSHAEQVGLLMAARLLGEVDEPPVRLALATAVSDEAKHAEVFARYAMETGGSIGAPEDYVRNLFDGMDRAEHFVGRFLIHTILEGLATDEFKLLIEPFEGDPLAVIHDRVRRDEARHVMIGIDYLSAKLRDPALEGWDFERYEQLALQLSGIPTSPLTGLATLARAEPAALRAWFLSRHQARMRRIRGKGGETS